MIVHLIIGALTMAGFFLLLDYAKKKELQIKWWQWLLTALGILYAVFVLEVWPACCCCEFFPCHSDLFLMVARYMFAFPAEEIADLEYRSRGSDGYQNNPEPCGVDNEKSGKNDHCPHDGQCCDPGSSA